MKKRVLQFIGSFHQGGSERQMVAMTRLLKNEGTFEVYAATLNNEGILRPEIEGIGLPEIPEFPLTSFYNVNFVHQVWRCSKYLRDNKIDLVHTHDFYTNVFGMAAATLAGVKARVASKRETSGMRSGAQEFIEKLAFGRAGAIVANSDSVRKHLTDHGTAVGKIKIIYNGIDLKRFDNINRDRTAVCQKLGLPASEEIRFITLVANLRHNVKNVPMLLRTAKRVIETVPAAHFVIAGEGELEAGLEETAKQLGVADNVHFIGRCADVPTLLSVSYAGVLTSTAEGFSNSILEYMAAAKPVVATNVGGAGEAIIDGETGYLVRPNDADAMAAYIVELCKDVKKANGFGAEGKRIVGESFSVQAQLEEIMSLYNSLLRRD